MTLFQPTRRRGFLRTSAGFAVGTSALAASAVRATSPRQQEAIQSRSGFMANPSTYYDMLSPAQRTDKPPMVLIHGGAHTGSCFMTTADGRPGWAYAFATRGYEVVVPDWPGIGRSGYVPFEALSGELVVQGLGQVLRSLDRPAIVMTHSMSGPFGWKLLELYGDRIASLVAIAPGGPGNVSAPTEFLSVTPEFAEVRLAPGAPVLKVNRKQPFVPEAAWASKKLVAGSTRFPREHLDAYLRQLNVIPPRLLLERVNFENSAPRVRDFKWYQDKRVALIVGTEDPDHTPQIDRPIVDWLNKNGAKAEFIELASKGVRGNGHMMMLESNSDQLADGIVAWLESGRYPSEGI